MAGQSADVVHAWRCQTGPVATVDAALHPGLDYPPDLMTTAAMIVETEAITHATVLGAAAAGEIFFQSYWN